MNTSDQALAALCGLFNITMKIRDRNDGCVCRQFIDEARCAELETIMRPLLRPAHGMQDTMQEYGADRARQGVGARA